MLTYADVQRWSPLSKPVIVYTLEYKRLQVSAVIVYTPVIVYTLEYKRLQVSALGKPTRVTRHGARYLKSINTEPCYADVC